jgi:MinD superfamily P-loop ATPase
MSKEVNLFTFITQIQSKRRTVPYDSKIAPAYVLSLFLSMNKKYIEVVNRINQYMFVLPDEVIYEYYMKCIPEIPYDERYAKFVKKRTEDDKTKERLDKIRKMYPELPIKECKMILSSLTRRR